MPKLTAGDWFIMVVAVLQIAGAVSYALKKQWIQVLIWGAAACISFGTTLLSIKSRP